jgi:atlastin
LLDKKNPVAHALSEEEKQEKGSEEESEKKAEESESNESENQPLSEKEPTAVNSSSTGVAKKPFQRLQFLVRDWQNFDAEFHEGDANFEEFQRNEMDKYLNDVFKARKASDLQSTREQILKCFEKLDCFMLPYPGTDVTKKNYDGAIKSISVDFKTLLNEYVRQIFDQELEAKLINNRFITGLELKNFFEVYVKMFQAGAKQFPRAMTMLEATAEANNRSAYDLALKSYKDSMNDLVGEDQSYVNEIAVHDHNREFLEKAIQIFNEIANMGPEDKINQSRQLLLETIEQEKKRYFETNSLKNPYKDMEYYLLPLTVGVASYFLAKFIDKTCSTDFCEAAEDTFQNIYLFVFVMMLVVFWKQVRTAFFYLKEMIPVLAGGGKIDLQSLTGGGSRGQSKGKSNKKKNN